MAQRWEYLVQFHWQVPADDGIAAYLARLGEKGWELVSLRSEPDPHFPFSYYDLVFKRPKGGDQ